MAQRRNCKLLRATHDEPCRGYQEESGDEREEEATRDLLLQHVLLAENLEANLRRIKVRQVD